MADLSDRGQILLIAAFTLAVTFVALALVVNSAIFTENLASRGEVSGSSEALVQQHEVRQSVGAAMAFANLYNTSDASTLEDSVKDSILDIGTNGGTQQARGGQLVNVSFESRETGKRIAFNESGGAQFLDSSDTHTGWQLAEDVEDTRQIQLNVTDKVSLDSPTASPFTLVANQSDTSGTIWRMELAFDSPHAVVDVETADGDTATCEIDVSGVSQFEVDVTRGLVNGTRCHALTRAGSTGTKMWFATGIPSGSSYNISFENGDNIEGNFSMVTRGGTMNSTTLINGNAPDDPFHTDALYSTTVNYVFVRPNVIYEAEIEVAPGEHP